MKNESRHENIGTQQVENVADLDISCTKIHSGLQSAKQALHQMIQAVNTAHKSRDIVLGRNPNAVVLGIPEPYMEEEK